MDKKIQKAGDNFVQATEHRATPLAPLDDGKELLGKNTGYVVGVRGDELLRLDTDAHFISIAKTGGGKGRSAVITNLLVHPGSALSVEIGGATLLETIRFRRHVLGQKIYVFDPHGQTEEPTANFNLLDTLDPSSKSFEADVGSMVDCIMQDATGDQVKEVYFRNEPGDVLRALIIYLKTAPEEELPYEKRNFVYLAELLGRYGSSEWDELMFKLKTDTGRYRLVLNKVGNYFSGKERNENLDGIVGSASMWLGFARDTVLGETLKKSDFKLSDLRNDKITIYMVMKDAKKFKQYHTWLRLMIERAMDACPNKADAGRNFRYEDRVLFMIDEFTQLGKLQAVEEGMQTARQKGITLWTIFQDIGRLKDVYGDNLTNSFLGSAACIQAFAISEPMTAEFISQRVGKNIVLIPSVSKAVGRSQTDTKNESFTLSNGESFANQVGRSEGRSETWTTSRNRSVTQSVGGAFSYGSSSSYGGGGSGGGSHSSTSGNWNTSTTEGSSNSHSDGVQETTTKSDTTTTSRQTGEQTGTSVAEGLTETVTLQYAVQVLPKLDVGDVYNLLNSDDSQILMITQGGNKAIIEKRAYYDKIPCLAERASGPLVPAFPKPKKIGDAPRKLTRGVEGDDVKLNLPKPPLGILAFGRIAISSIPDLQASAGSPGQRAQSNAAPLPYRAVHETSVDTLENAKIEAVNLIAASIQETQRAYQMVRQDISDKTRSVARYADEVAQARARVAGAATLLSESRARIENYAALLDSHAEELRNHAHMDYLLRKGLPEFERYGECYYFLRENVWPKLKPPVTPVVRSSNNYAKFAEAPIDYRLFEKGDSVAKGAPSVPPEVSSRPESLDIFLPPPPSIAAIIENARILDKNYAALANFNLAEIDVRLGQLHDQLTPRSIAGKGRKALSKLVSSNVANKEAEGKLFSEARAKLVDQIHEQAVRTYQSYLSSVASLNGQIEEGEKRWRDFHISSQMVAVQSEAAVRDNARIGQAYRNDLARLNGRHDGLLRTRNTILGQRTQMYAKMAGFSFWERAKEQTCRLKAAGFVEDPSEKKEQAPEDLRPDLLKEMQWLRKAKQEFDYH